MGTSKPEKRMKKTKKRGRELVNEERSDGFVKSSKFDNKQAETDLKEDDVAAAEVRAHKSKKLRKSKKKDTLVSNEQTSVVNNEEESEPVVADHPRGKKHKSNKVLKRSKKDTVVSGVKSSVVSSNADELKSFILGSSDGKKDKSKKARKTKKKGALLSNKQNTVNSDGDEILPDARISSTGKKGKSKRAHTQGKDDDSAISESNIMQENQEVAMVDVYQISSGEDDDSKGMKRWIKEYHERRPGLKVLQERIDEFITAYDEREEQAKKEREAQMADEGWTVVVHRKGGKKTTDSESGVAVGGVAEAAVREKMAKKKSKDVGLDFYRFQRKEAHRSEIMKLQSKFEEDKKRIQQLRAARKFKPY